MERYFVFAEFGSDEVRRFLLRLRAALSGGNKSSTVHVTLRGPYAAPPSQQELNELAIALRGYGVKIHDHGYFATATGFAVFLRAECTPFRELWDKPDYRVPKALIQPHVTMYESANRAAAQRARDFLRAERIHIHTYNLFLRVFQSHAQQGQLFDLPVAKPHGNPVNRDLWRVKDDVIERARILGEQLAKAGGG